jgi:hypothetical protein
VPVFPLLIAVGTSDDIAIPSMAQAEGGTKNIISISITIATAKKLDKFVYVVSRSGLQLCGTARRNRRGIFESR